MAELVEVPFDGGTILFASAGSSGPQAFSGAAAITRAAETLDQVLDHVRDISEAMAKKLSGLPFASAQASFGVSFTGKGKFIVAEASAEASLTFTITFEGDADNRRE